jgi:hypothetical protein
MSTEVALSLQGGVPRAFSVCLILKRFPNAPGVFVKLFFDVCVVPYNPQKWNGFRYELHCITMSAQKALEICKHLYPTRYDHSANFEAELTSHGGENEETKTGLQTPNTPRSETCTLEHLIRKTV